MRSWLGLDIGTSSLKALMVSDNGDTLARSSIRYDDADTDATGEQDPRVWLAAAEKAVSECLATGGVPDGVGLAGQVPTLVAVDRDGDWVRPALTWQDNRAVAEAAELEATFPSAMDQVGMDLPWSASHLPAKLLWLARHEPETLSRTAHILDPKGLLGLRLTGDPVNDAWSMKGAMNIRTGRPATSVLDACGWSSDVCAPAAAPWSSRGVTTDGALGLPAGIPVSVGWSDALASMLAVGAFTEPRAFILTGTSEIVGMTVSADSAQAPGLYDVPLECAPRAVLYGPTQSSGATVAWLSRLFGHSVENLLQIAEDARRHSTAVFVPYLSGERAPLWRPDVRALFSGVSAGDSAPELIRSVLRGVAMTARHILDIATTASGDPLREVHIAGRGVSDTAWQSLRLESLGVPVLFHEEPYVSALGAAMLAAAAVDGSLDATNRLRKAPVRVEPTEQDVAFSRSALDEYLRASALARTWSDT